MGKQADQDPVLVAHSRWPRRVRVQAFAGHIDVRCRYRSPLLPHLCVVWRLLGRGMAPRVPQDNNTCPRPPATRRTIPQQDAPLVTPHHMPQNPRATTRHRNPGPHLSAVVPRPRQLVPLQVRSRELSPVWAEAGRRRRQRRGNGMRGRRLHADVACLMPPVHDGPTGYGQSASHLTDLDTHGGHLVPRSISDTRYTHLPPYRTHAVCNSAAAPPPGNQAYSSICAHSVSVSLTWSRWWRLRPLG